MKKIISILALTLFATVDYTAQTEATTVDGKKVVLNEDGTWNYSDGAEREMGVPEFEDKSFYWKDGYDELVSVKFLNALEGDGTMDKAIFDNMIMNALVKAKYRLKNKLSFVPRELSIMNDKEGGYYVQVIYLGKNAYGAEGEEKTTFLFDSTGEVTGSF